MIPDKIGLQGRQGYPGPDLDRRIRASLFGPAPGPREQGAQIREAWRAQEICGADGRDSTTMEHPGHLDGLDGVPAVHEEIAVLVRLAAEHLRPGPTHDLPVIRSLDHAAGRADVVPELIEQGRPIVDEQGVVFKHDPVPRARLQGKAGRQLAGQQVRGRQVHDQRVFRDVRHRGVGRQHIGRLAAAEAAVSQRLLESGSGVRHVFGDVPFLPMQAQGNGVDEKSDRAEFVAAFPQSHRDADQQFRPGVSGPHECRDQGHETRQKRSPGSSRQGFEFRDQCGVKVDGGHASLAMGRSMQHRRRRREDLVPVSLVHGKVVRTQIGFLASAKRGLGRQQAWGAWLPAHAAQGVGEQQLDALRVAGNVMQEQQDQKNVAHLGDLEPRRAVDAQIKRLVDQLLQMMHGGVEIRERDASDRDAAVRVTAEIGSVDLPLHGAGQQFLISDRRRQSLDKRRRSFPGNPHQKRHVVIDGAFVGLLIGPQLELVLVQGRLLAPHHFRHRTFPSHQGGNVAQRIAAHQLPIRDIHVVRSPDFVEQGHGLEAVSALGEEITVRIVGVAKGLFENPQQAGIDVVRLGRSPCAPSDAPHQGRNVAQGFAADQLPIRDIHVVRSPDFVEQGHGLEAVSALGEEITVRIVGVAKGLFENPQQAGIDVVLVRQRPFRPADDGPQGLAIDLAGDRDRHGLQRMPEGRNHVSRQVVLAPANDGVDAAASMQHQKSGQHGLIRSIPSPENKSLADGPACFEKGGHFSEFDAVAPDLDLIVSPTDQDEIPIFGPGGKVPGGVDHLAASAG